MNTNVLIDGPKTRLIQSTGVNNKTVVERGDMFIISIRMNRERSGMYAGAAAAAACGSGLRAAIRVTLNQEVY